MSDSDSQEHQPQLLSLNQALAKLRATRIELEQTRERLFVLRTEVDTFIAESWENQKDTSFGLLTINN